MKLYTLKNVHIHLYFLPQGYPGEKGSSDVIDFNGKLLDAIQVSNIVVLSRPDLGMHLRVHRVFITESFVRRQAKVKEDQT